MFENVDMTAFEKLIAESDDLNIIDVRPEASFKEGHVPGAKNIPLGQHNEAAKDLDSKKDYYIICRSGNTSQVVCQDLSDQGIKAINVQGGTNAYTNKLEK